MRLITYQCPHFNIVDDVSDVKYSLHYNDPVGPFNQAYDWLFKQLGHKNILWCWFDGENECSQFISMFVHQRKWTLEIPDEEILAVIDYDDWHSILNDGHVVTREQWKKFEEAPDLDKAWDKWEQETDKHSTWPNVFLDIKPNIECGQYIIKSPVKKEWVVNVENIYGPTTELDIYDNIYITTVCSQDNLTSPYIMKHFKNKCKIEEEAINEHWKKLTVTW